MVWIHGGSFLAGSGASGLYRGEVLAQAFDVVVVTINYRLGVLGFLAHPALGTDRESWFGDRTWNGIGNWGLADQIAALRWVRHHIERFGGDPENITVFGESAGGMSVASLMAAPAATGLFHRAVIQSGPPYSSTIAEAASLAEEIGDLLGIPMEREAFESVSSDALVRAADVVARRRNLDRSTGILWLPVLDGGLLSEGPASAVLGGSAAGVPLLIGTTKDESSTLLEDASIAKPIDLAGLTEWVERITLDFKSAATLIDAVRDARASRGEGVSPMTSGWLSPPSTRSASRRSSSPMPTRHPPGRGSAPIAICSRGSPLPPMARFHSCHELEIPFVFGTLRDTAFQDFTGGGVAASELSLVMSTAWTQFARTGRPDGWTPWETQQRPTAVVGPWSGDRGLSRMVDRPRDAELNAVDAALVG